MAKWNKAEQQYMLELVKEFDAAKENAKGEIYVPYNEPAAYKVAEELNSVYNNGRTNHAVRKRVQKLSIPADTFFERINKVNKQTAKQEILNHVYGKVDYETFIKIQSL